MRKSEGKEGDGWGKDVKEGGAKPICYEVMKEGGGGGGGGGIEHRLEYIIHTALLISIPMLVFTVMLKLFLMK